MGIGRTLAIAAAVLAIPGACGLGVLALGRALDESSVAEGTLVSPEARRRQFVEARRRFLAMSPEQHLREAREALARGYDADAGVGGDFHAARMHLGAVTADAGLDDAVTAMRAEMDARSARYPALLRATLQQLAREAPSRGSARTDRCDVSRALRERVHAPCIHDTGDDGRRLMLGGFPCTREVVSAAVDDPVSAGALRRAGFREVECEHHAEATRRSL